MNRPSGNRGTSVEKHQSVDRPTPSTPATAMVALHSVSAGNHDRGVLDRPVSEDPIGSILLLQGSGHGDWRRRREVGRAGILMSVIQCGTADLT